MSDPFTNPSHTHASSTQEDHFSDFVSFDQFGQNKKKSSKWTGFKEQSQMEKNFQNFNFKPKTQPPQPTPNPPSKTHSDFQRFEKAPTPTQYANVNININNNNINFNGPDKYFQSERTPGFFGGPPQKKSFDTFNSISFAKHKTPFDDDESDFNSHRTNQAQNIFADNFGVSKKKQKEHTLRSDEMNPFDDDEEEGSGGVTTKEVLGGRGGLWNAQRGEQLKQQMGNSAVNKQSVEAQFDAELEASKEKRYMQSPFEVRVEDKVESAYEYIGRKIKQGGKALRKLDKKVLGWINPPKDTGKAPVNSHLLAEVQSRSIQTFIGGQQPMAPINLDTNKKLNFDLGKMIKEIQNDKPLVKRIRTKKDMQREKMREKALNPFEDDTDLPPLPPNFSSSDRKMEKYFGSNTSSNRPQPQSSPMISTPFIDDFTKEDFDFDDKNIFSNKINIFSKPGQASDFQKRATPKIFDDDNSIFGGKKAGGNDNGFGDKAMQRVMADDFLNFHEMDDAAKHISKKDPFADDFF